jgi:hypothetical protein
MMRFERAAAIALVLSACTQKHEAQANQASVSEKATSAEGNSSASTAAPSPGQPEEGSSGHKPMNLPPASAALRFVGVWATSEANCASQPWRFTAHELSATNGPHCSFYKVTKMPGGYDLAAQCPTKKPLPTDLIKLRFAESAGAMLVESNAIAPTGLIYCEKKG